ncbi:MAG: hypothetical protein ACKO6N_06640 [Myxococcota bacterium]
MQLPAPRRWSVRPLALPLALLPALTSCVRDIEVPYVGDCTDYPAGAYDYGDFSVGDCLGAPTDVRFYEGPQGPVLLVVNSNGYMVFGDGSLNTYDWNTLSALVEEAQLEQATGPIPAPPILLTSDSRLVRSTLPMPYYSGKVELAQVPSGEGEAPVAFVSNRLSLTTNTYKDDAVYVVDLSDPLALAPFPVKSATEEDDPDSTWRLGVLEDPWDMAFASTEKGDYLFVVNQSDHSVSVIDTDASPMAPLTGSSVGLVTWPRAEDFTDVGTRSFAELGLLAVGNGVVADTWTLTYIESPYRLLFVGQEDGEGALGYADSIDGLSFTPGVTDSILRGGEDTAFDSLGVGRTSVIVAAPSDEANANYFFFYEGWTEVTPFDGSPAYRAPRIGMAYSSASTPLDVTKQNLQSEVSTDDYVLGFGTVGDADTSDDFFARGTAAPWVFLASSNLHLWFTGLDATGKASLGTTSTESNTILATGYTEALSVEWATPTALTFEGGDPGVAQRDATGFYDPGTGRFRLWFVSERSEGGSCLMYAESTDGAAYTLGGIENIQADCLDLPGAAVIRSPSVVLDGRLLRLWYSSAPDEAGPWDLHYAIGFDSRSWRALGDTPLDFDLDWMTGPPSPVVFRPNIETSAGGMRLTGERLLDAGAGYPLQNLIQPKAGELYFSVLHGQVLGVGARGNVVSLTDAQEEAEEEIEFKPASWDAYAIHAPAYDPTTETLYYTGIQEPVVEDEAARELPLYSGVGAASRKGDALFQWSNPECPSWPASSAEGCTALDTTRGLGEPDVVVYNSTRLLFFAEELGDGTAASIRRVDQPASGNSGFGNVRTLLEPLTEQGETHLLGPAVVPPRRSGDLWHMWFTSVSSSGRRIVYASSPDGLSWTRQSFGTWALDLGGAGDWDDAAVEAPSVVVRELSVDGVAQERWELFYSGSGGNDVYKIGVARVVVNPGTDPSTFVWERLSDANGSTFPILVGESDWWDAVSVRQPDVTFDGTRYWMFYEGLRNGQARIGLAQSFAGVVWSKVYEPLSTGDSFTFQTRLVSSEDNGSALGLEEGVLNLDVYFGGYQMCGNGATEIEVSPQGDIAVVSATYTSGLYVIDTQDDSTTDHFDDNYLGFEAALALEDSPKCYDKDYSNVAVRGARSVLFSPTGERIYATTKVPDSVIVIDRTQIVERGAPRLIVDGAILGSIELDPGSSEDQGFETQGDIGPIGLALSRDGRYLWVANGNGNSIYTIDLSLGAVGEVVAVARDVGEVPVALALSPDERFLVVANYVGELEQRGKESYVPHGSLVFLDTDPSSASFGQVVAQLKNLDLSVP